MRRGVQSNGTSVWRLRDVFRYWSLEREMLRERGVSGGDNWGRGVGGIRVSNSLDCSPTIRGFRILTSI